MIPEIANAELPTSPNYSYKGIASNPPRLTTPKGCDNGTNVVALGCTSNRHPTVDATAIELLTNRRLSHQSCMNDRVLMPIYESVINSPFSKVAIYSLLEIFKTSGWSVNKRNGKVNTEKEYIVGKYTSGTSVSRNSRTHPFYLAFPPASKTKQMDEVGLEFNMNDTYSTLFWLTVEIQRNTPDIISSWLICPDKTPLTITLTIAKVVGDTQKYYTGLVYWDPTDPVPLTEIVRRHILQLNAPANI